MIQHCIPLCLNRANCYILLDEISKEAVVIDPGEFNKELTNILSDENAIVKYILLTHGHYDHILGVYELKKYTGAQVGIHKNDADCLEDESLSHANQIQAKQNIVHADFEFEDGASLWIGKIEIEVIFTPGHTLGGVCFVCENEQKIFTGDTLFYHTIGRTDLQGGNMTDMQNSLLKISSIKGGYLVFPGHDRSSTLDEERKHNRYLRSL